MGNDHQGRWQVAQDVDEPLPGILIQVIGGLVQQQGLRLHGQHRGQCHQFFFSARQVVCQTLLKTGQPQTLQRGPGLFFCFRR